MSCAGPFHCSQIAGYIYHFCPLTAPDVGLPMLACHGEHTSVRHTLLGQQ